VNTRLRNNPLRVFQMQEALKEKPRSYDELARVTGLNKPAVARWVKLMRAVTPSPIFISGWGPDKNGRLFVPLFAWGTAPDAERPGDSRTDAERMRALRAARKGVL
jgi:hypothetical protein